MSTQTQTQNKVFPCNCNGCRNYPVRPAEIYHHAQIAGKANGYFFSKDTMKAFSSRIVDFKSVMTSSKTDGLSVIVSSKYGIDGAERYYEIVTICPYGDVNREWQDVSGEPIRKYKSLKVARIAWGLSSIFSSCSCHGCQLDRAGRK